MASRSRTMRGAEGGISEAAFAANEIAQAAYRAAFAEPGNPAADASGNVKYPNVNSLVEMTDMREAQRSYEANLNIITATRRMIQRTLDILKA